MPSPGGGGGAEEEKKSCPSGRTVGSDAAPRHQGGLPEESGEERCPSNDGVTASDQGDAQDEAQQVDPGVLRDKIHRRDNDGLKKLLAEKGETILETTYGGKDGGVDDDDLFSGTLPLLHAARHGREEVHRSRAIGPEDTLRTLLDAAKLEEQITEEPKEELKKELKEEMRKKDNRGRTLLHLVAKNGDEQAFMAVMGACDEILTKTEVLEMLRSTDTATGSTVLMAAASNVDGDMFKRVLGAMRITLREDETKTAEKMEKELEKKLEKGLGKDLSLTDNLGGTLLHAAIASGEGPVTSVTSAWRCNLPSTEVLRLLKLRDNTDSTALMAAAGSGSWSIISHVLFCTEYAVGRNDIKLKEHLEDVQYEQLLERAARNGSGRVFGYVWEACRDVGLEAPQTGVRRNFHCGGVTALMEAVESGEVDTFKDAWSKIEEVDRAEKLEIIEAKNVIGDTLLSKAVECGDADLFELVRKCAWGVLSPDEREAFIESKNIFGDSLLAKAFDTGNAELFTAVLNCTWAVLGDGDHHHQLRDLIEFTDVDGRASTVASPSDALDLSRLLLQKAVDTIDVSIMGAAVNSVVGRCESVGAKLSIAEIVEIIRGMTYTQFSFLQGAISEVLNYLSSGCEMAEKRSSEMDSVFAKWTDSYLWYIPQGVNADETLYFLSTLIANSVRPSAIDLGKLSNVHGFDGRFKSCCLRAVTCSVNPFVPGLTLSIRLSEAARQASEGQRRTLQDIKSSVDDLLLEIFERLPQTVLGFDQEGGTGACSSVLEPESMKANDDSNDLRGPLEMIVSEQQQLETFCVVPLVMDFLSSKFALGLPDLLDTVGVLRSDGQLEGLEESGLLLAKSDDEGDFSGQQVAYLFLLLQGTRTPYSSLTFLPGAQFIVAGMVAAPTRYYSVPAARMLLDFVVYVGMVTALTYCVLFHSSTNSVPGDDSIVDHSFSLPEAACALIFITAGVYREGREMKRDIRRYFKDQWNVLDALGILCLCVGVIIRWDDWTSPWGPAFYALSAPLVVSRVLFFAQILQFQGPMIQVIFRMTSTLLQFGAVILVVIIGFAMALHVLFRDFDTFGETMLGLFKAMLGDTEIFDEFSGGRYDRVATILVIVYLFIVTIMLLNLLVAILSTAHAQVQENTGRESKVSKMRIVHHYRKVVENDLLPAPFNLVQLLLSLVVLCSTFLWCYLVETKNDHRRRAEAHRRASDHADHAPADTDSGRKNDDGSVFWGNVWDGAKKRQGSVMRAFGRLVFWVVLGPVAVTGGAILWGLSGFGYAQYVWLTSEEEVDEEEIDSNTYCSSCISPRLRVLQGLCIVFAWLRRLAAVALTSGLMLVCCTLVAPCCLFVLWLILPGFEFLSWCWKTSTSCLRKGTNADTEVSEGVSNKRTVESMLKHGRGGVGVNKLREFLQNPMDDDDVRQDEKEKKPTVEDIKLLRDRLISSTKSEVAKLGERLEEMFVVVDRPEKKRL